MTDTSTRPARAAATRWDRSSSLQTSAELLLGLSFAATVAFGGYAAVTGHMVLLSQASGIVFLVTLMCVLVSWFRAVEREDASAGRRQRDAHVTARASAGAARASADRSSAARVAAATSADRFAADPIAAIDAIDAEYRR